MTSFTKIIFRLLLLGIISIAAAYHLSSNIAYTNNVEENAVKTQISRHQRAIKPATLRHCKLNQYYDQEEGRCLGVPGGGKVLHIENERSCGVNILKPHCTNSLYYHICKRDKSILAQCASGQIFDNRLQRCIYYISSSLTPSTIRPDSTVCVPDAPDENVESLNLDEVTEENIERTSGTSEESQTTSENDPVTGEENVNFKNYDDNISATPVSVINNPLSIDNSDNDGDTHIASNTQSIEEVPDNISETSTSGQAPNPIENAQETSKVQNEDELSTVELDNDTPHSITSDSTKPEYRTNADLNSNLDSETTDTPSSVSSTLKSDEGMQDVTTEQYKGDDETVTLSNSNIAPIDQDLTSTVSNIPEFSSISDTPSKDEETQDVTTEQDKYNEDSSVTLPYSGTEINQDPTSTISNIPEFSPVSDTPSKIDEETQDAITEQYRNNEDSTVIPSYSNTEAIDQDPTSRINNMPESSLTSDTPSILNEEMQGVTTEQYSNYDRAVTLPNSNTEVVDQNPISTLSDKPTITDSLNSDDFNTPLSTSIPATLSPQATINDDEHVMEGLDEPSYSKPADTDLHTPDEIENVSA